MFDINDYYILKLNITLDLALYIHFVADITINLTENIIWIIILTVYS